MPILQLRYAPAPGFAARPKPAIVAAVNALTVKLLDKKADLIATIATEVDPADWFVAGESLSRRGWGASSLRSG
ncbi:tautomerase family protein [Methylobrevis pamukkalensis]|uniref:4-oxalocrotonate tautomerase n=1 Tax=Methylobrevis pamukkalensis TaxID=1439726 RepID=A0A1E3H6X8_9HYPH|nr:hypothetical protein A6302_00569 [Methylobrevis pamukkalensis]